MSSSVIKIWYLVAGGSLFFCQGCFHKEFITCRNEIAKQYEKNAADVKRIEAETGALEGRLRIIDTEYEVKAEKSARVCDKKVVDERLVLQDRIFQLTLALQAKSDESGALCSALKAITRKGKKRSCAEILEDIKSSQHEALTRPPPPKRGKPTPDSPIG